MVYDDHDYYSYGFRPYVSVAARRARAARELAKLRKNGRAMSPIAIEGRKIASTFWGKAWCDNLERYSDYANRLPRGRTYARNGSVVDLQIGPGRVTALVSGSAMYDVQVTVGPVPQARWSAICKDCSGAIDSLVELLQGRFSKGVMTRLCEEKTGMFPSPKDIRFTCSCPDWASMCKHVAAVLYGVGARLDRQPELLFTLRVRVLDERQATSRHEGARERRSVGDVRHRDGAGDTGEAACRQRRLATAIARGHGCRVLQTEGADASGEVDEDCARKQRPTADTEEAGSDRGAHAYVLGRTEDREEAILTAVKEHVLGSRWSRFHSARRG
jgi:uncharacterized Zn finger protein